MGSFSVAITKRKERRKHEMSTILALTHGRDDCADLVINHLRKRGEDFVRFNTDEFQKSVKLTLTMEPNGSFGGKYHFPDRDLDFREIGVVWNRRVHEPELGEDLQGEPEIKQWMIDESFWGMSISFTLIDAPVVNPWEINERLKFNKMLQMKRAAELGLEVPSTCITNNLDEIREFWKHVGGEMVFKKIRKGLFAMSDGRVLLVHTNQIPKDSFNEQTIQRMRFCPMFLQRHIPKKFDVRSIVVNGKVFSVAIHSQSVAEGVTDYRKAAVLGKLDEMRHEIIDFGAETNQKLANYTRSFGLSFSAIDLIVTPDDRVIFLEDNPNGQWAWLEHKTGIPISKAIAEYLIGLNSIKERDGRTENSGG